MVNIGSDRRCLARHGEIIRHKHNYPPTPRPHSMETDLDGQADLALKDAQHINRLQQQCSPPCQPSGQHAPLPLGYEHSERRRQAEAPATP